MRKEKSTNYFNEEYLNKNCGITFTMSKIDGRWKINILAFLLNNRKLRYSELKNLLKGISERMLIAKLRELEKDGLINRIVHQQVPPKVEYELTGLALSLKEIFHLMDKWGEKIQRNRSL